MKLLDIMRIITVSPLACFFRLRKMNPVGFIVKTALHAWVEEMYAHRDMVALYVAGTRFDFHLSWRVVSALHGFGEVFLRFWLHFPHYTAEHVHGMLSHALGTPPSLDTARKLAGRGRFSYAVLEAMHAYWNTAEYGTSPPQERTEKIIDLWFAALVKKCVEEFEKLPEHFTEELAAFYSHSIHSPDRPFRMNRRGVFPSLTTARFVVSRLTDPIADKQLSQELDFAVEPITRLSIEQFFARHPTKLLGFISRSVQAAPTPQAAASHLDSLLAVLFRGLSNQRSALCSVHQ
jgi:hypothetical protein